MRKRRKTSREAGPPSTRTILSRLSLEAQINRLGSMPGEELRQWGEFFPIAFGPLPTRKDFRPGRVMQPIGVMHTPHNSHFMHQFGHVRQVFADLNPGSGSRNRIEFTRGHLGKNGGRHSRIPG